MMKMMAAIFTGNDLLLHGVCYASSQRYKNENISCCN
jgi:hypothetical protein